MVGNDTIHTVTRKEHDCIGYMDVPKDVYGASIRSGRSVTSPSPESRTPPIPS